MERYPKRLIEVDLPIARISAHARREKSIRHGHISTLHIWWARRPLAACRAVICASLWPDPADELCPPAFREAAATQLMAFVHRMLPARINDEGHQLQATASPESRGRWEGLLQSGKDGLPLDPTDAAHQQVLQGALLDFIADFANWDNSTVPAYLETSRALTQAAHEALGGVPGTRPLVVDPFAGGGSIPLEALRVGGDAFASDLNPVAVLLNKVALEYIPKRGKGLAEEVRNCGHWVKEHAEKELAEFYPRDLDGATPIAYLWARTVLSEAPGDEVPVELPLLRSFWLCKKTNRRIALRWVRDKSGAVVTVELERTYSDGTSRVVRQPQLEIFEPTSESDVDSAVVARGSATCPITGFTTPASSVRAQLTKRRGGSTDARMTCVVMIPHEGKGRYYRLPRTEDIEAVASAASALRNISELKLNGFSFVPSEPTPLGKGKGAGRAFSQRIYGMESFADLHTPRQILVLGTLAKTILECPFAKRDPAVQTLLAFGLGRVNDQAMTLCRWRITVEAIAAANGGQNKMPVITDFVEANTFGDRGGDWMGQIEWVARFVEHVADSITTGGQSQQSDAQTSVLPHGSVDALVTDPPYYDAFPYSDLSDFFFVWLKRALPAESLRYDAELVPKDDEIVVYDVVHGEDGRNKDRKFFASEMTRAFEANRKAAHPRAIGLVVFANKTTEGWEALIQSILDAGWTATASWPIDTERPSRQRALESAALGSSVHVVCRPRENEDGSLREDVGEWRDVLSELPKRIHEWMPRLAAEGVVGADAIFACLGPALEIFSRYSRVEKASGEAVPLREYLEHVWATVSTEALSMIFKDADAAGLEPDARLTAMWLWTLGGMETNGSDSKSSSDSDEKVVASKGYTLEYDAARKIAQGLGVHLEQSDSIVEVKGDKARLLPVSERTRHLFGKDQATTTTRGKKKKPKAKQLDLFKTIDEIEAEADETVAGELKPQAGETVLDRVHQSMILFASGRGEALKRFLDEDGAGKDARFWKLAQSLSALYPKETDEKRWVDGVLARKKGLGL